jgi:hypothetical protein
MSRVQVLRHVARLVTRLITPLVVDYSASRRLVVDYFTYAARPGASARRAARHRLLRLAQPRRQLLRLCRTSGCLGTSCGSSRGSSLTTSTMSRVQVPQHVARLVTRLVAPLVVDYSASHRLAVEYFTYAVRPGASARRAARRRLLRLRRASGCLGSSRGSSSTTSTTSRVRMPQHVAQHVTRLITPLVIDYFASRRLVVDYFAYTTRPVASARRAACHAAHRRLLRLRCAFGCLGTSRGSSRDSSSTTSTMPRV